MFSHKRINSVRKVITFFSSMKVSIFLLLFLAAVMSLGSLIPQGQSEMFYRAHYGRVLGSFINLFSLDHLYSAWWFVGTSIFFAFNILVCAANRIRISLKNYRQVGSLLLHLSILAIVAGAYVSGLTGRSEYVEIGVGDAVDLSSKGFPQRVITVKNFKIEHYDNLEPKQYISDLELTTSKGEKIRREIKVNYPLKTDGLKIYQVNYGWMIRGQVIAEKN